jgi:hypothetical protein
MEILNKDQVISLFSVNDYYFRPFCLADYGRRINDHVTLTWLVATFEKTDWPPYCVVIIHAKDGIENYVQSPDDIVVKVVGYYAERSEAIQAYEEYTV